MKERRGQVSAKKFFRGETVPNLFFHVKIIYEILVKNLTS
jgi:hypothetical protein